VVNCIAYSVLSVNTLRPLEITRSIRLGGDTERRIVQLGPSFNGGDVLLLPPEKPDRDDTGYDYPASQDT
jgi:hypothetical protein